MSRLLAPAALATALLLAACGGGDGPSSPRPGAQGSYSGNVSGGVTRSITGVAYYGQSATGGNNDAGFAIGMGSVNADKSFKDMVAFVRAKRDIRPPAPTSCTT
jgi:hypothetical protein